jgi:hypothetical protein
MPLRMPVGSELRSGTDKSSALLCPCPMKTTFGVSALDAGTNAVSRNIITTGTTNSRFTEQFLLSVYRSSN